MDLEDTLRERGSRYGAFDENAPIAQAFKDLIRKYPGWHGFAPDLKEAWDMAFSKLSRALIGDSEYPDNAHDIAGYFELVAKRQEKDEMQPPRT